MMKISKIGLVTISILALAILPSLAPTVRAQSANATWINTTFTGQDPLFGFTTVNAYGTGVTATLQLATSNGFGTITVTSYNLAMDWGTNYTATSLTTAVKHGTIVLWTITFTAPSTSTASNMVMHSGSLVVNYTDAFGNKNQRFFVGVPEVVIYSSDQATAISLMQQTSFLASGGISICSFDTLKSSQAVSLCAQATQQNILGRNAYSMGNFTAAKTYFQNSVNDWNSALSTETSTGGGLQLSNTIGGYGSLLLGIGALVGGVAGILYAMRRPKGMGMTPATH
ncbi:MAG: hypothetical protein AUF79_15630 [Crenarchaeota archaeon 13_1_20CM_2_51_8]|nr:MAG: hypothetical protein AUF79_15630 [Crenarchaeota archaeon 13_1_20CM_2_51_8]